MSTHPTESEVPVTGMRVAAGPKPGLESGHMLIPNAEGSYVGVKDKAAEAADLARFEPKKDTPKYRGALKLAHSTKSSPKKDPPMSQGQQPSSSDPKQREKEAERLAAIAAIKGVPDTLPAQKVAQAVKLHPAAQPLNAPGMSGMG